MRRAPWSPCPRGERGIALVLSLFAIVVIGMLATGVFVAGRLEMAGGRATVMATHATEAAEAGMNDMLANWSVAYNTFGLYGDSVFPTVSLTGTRYTQTLTRMAGGKYLLKVRGDRLNAAGTVIATRYLGRFLRLAIPYLDIQAAVTAQDGITAGGNIDITGADTNPPGWTGCAAPVNKAGGRSAGDILVHGASSMTGTPAQIEYDSTVVDSIFTVPFNSLKAQATRTLAPGTYNGMAPSVTGTPSVCNRADANNWGEPYAAPTPGIVTQCQGYFPIIYVPGNLSVSGGRGQGILLVEGNAAATGGFIFDGIIIALGDLQVNGNGNKVTGAVLTAGTTANLHGTPDIFYSSCAIYRALQYSVRAEPMADRSWAQRTN
jgi:hypothetical protein